ncbi:alkaline phosphatase D family protein [Polaribacter haliotis]|uniref:Alkaline phosphatase D family protein n=1 Tax=Polaribacter haliotis TaxID=1888915 RepID=A0A7L8AFX9_9FLAO|nr:alkaline phosphatase D family protein [Polaribacter haliotis]QOD60916.1 alkaline phosphatase D family protein [Polaribacter haliotis]
MDRRKYLKTITLGSIIPFMAPSILAKESFSVWSYKKGVNFKSDWHNWNNMKWIGPEYWGNRLQDWVLQDKAVVCDITGKNRNLHLLPLQKPKGLIGFTTNIKIEILNNVIKTNTKACIGFRLGAEGPFKDYRSAAVFGKGLDIGLNGKGDLKVGKQVIKTSLKEIPSSFHLIVEAIPQQTNYLLKISAINPINNQFIVKEEKVTLEDKDLTGNFSLIADVPGKMTNEIASKASVKFSDWSITSEELKFEENHFYGPINFAQYTLNKNKLKLTAQFSPIEEIKGHSALLQFRINGNWETATTETIKNPGRAVNFIIENWQHKTAIPYRVLLKIPLRNKEETYNYEGTIAAEPINKTDIKAAVFSCNAHYGFPDADVYESVSKLTPDLAMFLGDQFYENTGGFGPQYHGEPDKICLDYLRKWYMFGWSYREIFRHIPCAIIPDDHDVYHGNVWGESGKKADTSLGFGGKAQDSGGYKMSADWVNMVQFTQTSHLPDPYDATPLKQNISVYYSNWNYGGISFAILEDRKFKSAPKNVLPKEADVYNGWIQNDNFDIKKYKHLDAELLGKRQEKFLNEWVNDWSNGSELKVVLSQTNFATVATIPQKAKTGGVIPSLRIPEAGEYVKGEKGTVDMDSNGWPAAKRDLAVSIIRKGFAFHIAGDQHLASYIQYGLDEHGDSGHAFAGPALNNLWPRRFWPDVDSSNHTVENPAYVGNHFDGFGNKMTVKAISNPQNSNKEPKILHTRAVGFGMVTFNKDTRDIKTECWPRFVDPTKENTQYPGWPITINQQDNYGRKAIAYLPKIKVKKLEKPVVEIINQKTNETEYSIRLNTSSFTPKVFDKNTLYTIKVGEPDTNSWQTKKDVSVNDRSLKFKF